MENIWTHFLSFEERHNLFDLKDEKGTYIWDIVRYMIYIDILWGDNSTVPNIAKPQRKKFRFLNVLFCYFKSLFVKGDYMFFLLSRNKYGEKFIDKNAYNAIQQSLSAKKRIIGIETYFDCSFSDLKQSDFHLLLPMLPLYGRLSKILRKRNYNFDSILSLVRTEFPECKIESSYLNSLYRLFYIQRSVYRFLLKRWSIQKVFFTQNGIQKGLIAACHDLNIPVYEFQHGIVDQGHIAYSYPAVNIANVYLPDKIAALSDFWFKDCILPYTCKIVSVGNDYFVPQKGENSDDFARRKGKILVVSADVFGVDLSDFVQQCMADPILKDYKFYFKLHTNQFSEYDYYSTLFDSEDNIIVTRNEKDIPTLIDETEAMLTIQSTAVYEGLQKGMPIYILKKSSYSRQERLFALPNVFLIDNVSDFRNNITRHSQKREQMKDIPQFFTSFNVDLFRKEFIDE